MPLRFILSTTVLLALAAGTTFAATGGLRLGPSSPATTRTFKGYYDGHKDTYLVTDKGCELLTEGFPADADSIEKSMR